MEETSVVIVEDQAAVREGQREARNLLLAIEKTEAMRPSAVPTPARVFDTLGVGSRTGGVIVERRRDVLDLEDVNEG